MPLSDPLVGLGLLLLSLLALARLSTTLVLRRARLTSSAEEYKSLMGGSLVIPPSYRQRHYPSP